MKQCEWCGARFTPKANYQIYCSTECRTAQTQKTQQEKRWKNRVNKNKSAKRICAGGCGTTLSIYNLSNYCSRCGVDKKKLDKEISNLDKRGRK